LSANLSIIDPAGQIDTFGHFYLGYKPDLYPAAVYDANLGDINDIDSIYSFLVNASHLLIDLERETHIELILFK
jgi:hypothetical protein